MEFGAAVWPFQWSAPYDDAIRRIAAQGFKQIELIAWNQDVLQEAYTPEDIRRLRHLLREEGLGLSEFVFTPRGVADADPTRRRAGIEQFQRAVEIAHELGTDIINSVVATPFELPFPGLLSLPQSQELIVDVPKGLDWAGGYDTYVESLQACCAACEQAGLRYALETHPYRWATTAMSLMRLIEHVGSSALGVNLDPSHMFPCGELPHVAVYQLGPRVFHTHFSDNDGVTNAHWRPGKGKIDWSALLSALRDVGYDGVISIELEDVPGRASASRPVAGEAFDHENRESRNYLSGIANRLGITLS